jgi:sugar phosphate isomerase/epimerase
MIVAIRAQYSTQWDWKESLEALHPIKDIELAFFKVEDFLAADLEKVITPIHELGINVPTIHMSHASQTEWWQFVRVLSQTIGLARALDCHNIVLHPSYGPVDGFDSLIDHTVMPLLGKCNLLWETFSGKRRVLTAWNQLAEFCERHEKNYICYDICHMHRSTEGAIKDIDDYGHLIKAYHFSNWEGDKQHLPIGEGVLDFGEIMDRLSDFEGSVTLEYLPQYHHQLVEDALQLIVR